MIVRNVRMANIENMLEEYQLMIVLIVPLDIIQLIKIINVLNVRLVNLIKYLHHLNVIFVKKVNIQIKIKQLVVKHVQ